jgi:hypothetical protein
MKIRSLVNADYEEWRGLWLSYLNFYETSLADEVINETFYRFIDDHQTKQNALMAEDKIGLVGLVHYVFILTIGKLRKFVTYRIYSLLLKKGVKKLVRC